MRITVKLDEKTVVIFGFDNAREDAFVIRQFARDFFADERHVGIADDHAGARRDECGAIVV